MLAGLQKTLKSRFLEEKRTVLAVLASFQLVRTGPLFKGVCVDGRGVKKNILLPYLFFFCDENNSIFFLQKKEVFFSQAQPWPTEGSKKMGG